MLLGVHQPTPRSKSIQLRTTNYFWTKCRPPCEAWDPSRKAVSYLGAAAWLGGPHAVLRHSLCNLLGLRVVVSQKTKTKAIDVTISKKKNFSERGVFFYPATSTYQCVRELVMEWNVEYSCSRIKKITDSRNSKGRAPSEKTSQTRMP